MEIGFEKRAFSSDRSPEGRRKGFENIAMAMSTSGSGLAQEYGVSKQLFKPNIRSTVVKLSNLSRRLEAPPPRVTLMADGSDG
jgi:hypothetical protein